MTDLMKCEAMAAALINKHLPGKGWGFEFDRARKRGGQCQLGPKIITMSRLLVPLWTDEQVRQTLLHEIAHALTSEARLNERGSGSHGSAWLGAARSIGYVGGRTHNNPTLVTQKKVPTRGSDLRPAMGRHPLFPGFTIRHHGRTWTVVHHTASDRVLLDFVHNQLAIPTRLLSRITPKSAREIILDYAT